MISQYNRLKKWCLRAQTTHLPAFSLVEVSIVLIIIGVLLGLVLSNTNLIGNARLKSVMVDVHRYRTAVNQYQETYRTLPPVDGGGLEQGSNAVKFWETLSKAGLISGVGAAPESGPVWGKGVPAAAIGGGFTVTRNPEGLPTGLWLVLGEKNGDHGTGALLTPKDAYEIDAKLDNGNPKTGWIVGVKGAGAAGECFLEEAYATDNPGAACVLYFKLN